MQKKFLLWIISIFLYLGIINSIGAQTMNDQQALSNVQQKVALIAAFTANGNLPQLKVVLNEGLDAGMTINQINEILIQMYAYVGFPRSLNGITTFMAVVQEREQKGIKDPQGEQPNTLPAASNKYEIGKNNLYQLTKVKPTEQLTGSAAFAPGIDTFLKEHLFADIFERGLLDFKARELATISALASIQGVDPMLEAHLNMGMNTGLTEAQLKQLITLINTHVGKQQADTAQRILNQVIKVRGQ